MKIICPNCNHDDVLLEDMQVGVPVTCVCNTCKHRFELHPYMIDSTDGALKILPVGKGKADGKGDPVNAPSHYTGKIECIDYLRDKLTKEEFTGFCMGNVLKYSSRWRKKDGVQDLKKAKVYLDWAIENEEQE